MLNETEKKTLKEAYKSTRAMETLTTLCDEYGGRFAGTEENREAAEYILGIYEELIKSLKSFDLIFLRLVFSLKLKDALDHASWRFLVALGLGILTAIFTLARVLAWLLQNQPVLIWSFFLGLIAASLFTVSRQA